MELMTMVAISLMEFLSIDDSDCSMLRGCGADSMMSSGDGMSDPGELLRRVVGIQYARQSRRM
jgi:hypothetical protein